MLNTSSILNLYSALGISGEMSAPKVVEPTELPWDSNMVSFPERRDATVDFPTPVSPTIETMVSQVSVSSCS